MDGVVIDSNHIHLENWNGVFKKRFNKNISEKKFAEHLGESPKEFTGNMLKIAGINSSYDDIYPIIKENYLKLKYKIKLKQGLVEILKKLKRRYKIALATGAAKENAIDTLNSFGISDYFDCIVGGDEVKRAKPDPEIFIKAAKMLKLQPAECAVIEDAKMGIIAAKEAGTFAISIPDNLTRHQDHGKADLHLKSIAELNDELLDKIGNK